MTPAQKAPSRAGQCRYRSTVIPLPARTGRVFAGQAIKRGRETLRARNLDALSMQETRSRWRELPDIQPYHQAALFFSVQPANGDLRQVENSPRRPAKMARPRYGWSWGILFSVGCLAFTTVWSIYKAWHRKTHCGCRAAGPASSMRTPL